MTAPIISPDEVAPVYIDYKEPLAKVEDGYGYMGTLATSVDRSVIQCHICGHWFGNLVQHVWSKHKVRSRDYKEKFGLAIGNSLMSETRRKEYMARFQAHHTEERKEQMRRVAHTMLASRKKQGSKKKWSLELRNKNGNCSDQIIEKIHEVEARLGHAPSVSEFIACYGLGTYSSLRYHYRNWTNAMKIAGKTPVSEALMRDPADLLDRINQFREIEGRDPLYADFRVGSILGAPNAYYKHFGGVREARKLADSMKLVVA